MDAMLGPLLSPHVLASKQKLQAYLVSVQQQWLLEPIVTSQGA